MNEHIKDTGLQVSRRSFVKSASGLTFSFALTGALLGRPLEAFAAEGAKLNAWVTIAADNTITILCPSSEMGQGVLTALPLILAEELDADWSKVKCELAPGNPKLFGGVHKMFPGAQVTLASVSVPAYYMPLRTAGAQARKVLLGEDLSWPNGEVVSLVEMRGEDETAAAGYLAVARKTLSQMRAEWNRLVFSGRANPPLRYGTQAEARNAVARLPGAIAVTDSSQVYGNVKMVLRIGSG